RAEEASVATLAEAWYQTACTTASCPPGLPPVNPYPADTLHVGATGGQEDSRSYLTLDASALPTGARLLGGTLRAPVAPDAGTRSPETAALRACLVTKTVEPAEASFATAPAVDCKTTAPGTFRAGTPRATFTFELAPFAAAWGSGSPSLALLPAEGAEPPGWHVAFDARDRAEGSPITATLRYEVASIVEPDLPAEDDKAEGAEDLRSGSGVAVLAAPLPEPVPAPPITGSEPLPVAQPAAPPFGPEEVGYRYPAAFLVPLGLLALGGALASSLTRRIPRAQRSPDDTP
ncbi:MAG: hypothetical protein ACRDKJ_01580, partial [Actinomycetota bacterium]